MFCPNCGTQIPDGSGFCPNCGARLGGAPAAGQNTRPPVSNPGPNPGRNPVNQNAATHQATASGGAAALLKKGGLLWVILGVVLVVIILFIVLAVNILGGASSKGQFVLLGDGDYSLLKSINGQPMEFDSLRGDDTNTVPNVHFSEDGKYAYYFSKVDDSMSGTLCRATLSKIRNRSDNSSAVEILDSNVLYYSVIYLDNNDLLYLGGDGSLQYYHDGEPITIDRNVSDFSLTEDQTSVVYTVQAEDGSQSLYAVTLSDPANLIKLAGTADLIRNANNINHIIYSYADPEKDYAQSLYTTDLSGNTEKLADGVTFSSTIDGKLYYVAANGQTVSLYDYVEDTYAAQDASAVEPDIDNYEVPYYWYRTLGLDANPSEYTELYTSCTDDLFRFDQGWDSMEDVVEDTWGDYSQATKTAVQSFIDKYSASADEDGYILVTDAVRSDLRAINATIEGATDSEWISLCLYKQQSGTTTDYDAYYADRDAYEQALSRKTLRESLQSPDQARDVLALYCLDPQDGSISLLVDNLANCTYEYNNSNLLIYRTLDQLTEKVPIDEITGSYDVVDKVFGLNSGELSVYDLDQQANAFTVDGEEYAEFSNLYYNGSTAIAVNQDKELLVSTISDGTAGDFSIEAENISNETFTDDGDLYFFADSYSDSSGYTYGDYYVYRNGEATRLVRDALCSTGAVSVMEDGMIVAETGRSISSNLWGYSREISLVNAKGESTYLADDISALYYLDTNRIVYLSDGDLYLYNGKERERIAEGVDMVWYSGETMGSVNY